MSMQRKVLHDLQNGGTGWSLDLYGKFELSHCLDYLFIKRLFSNAKITFIYCLVLNRYDTNDCFLNDKIANYLFLIVNLITVWLQHYNITHTLRHTLDAV